MSWFKLKDPFGTNYRVDKGDLMNTKRALNQLGYYSIPANRGIDDWTDDATFDGIRRFQRDSGLKVDAFMRPGGPTEAAINQRLQHSSFGAPKAFNLSAMESLMGCHCGPEGDQPFHPRPDEDILSVR
ncbi:peptidoglycan-binding domain-containing protein [Magnetospirillum aberrantis]|uniref:Peptidoglycan-binding protein n=1 Tax=Magnetospirillum aberrantis SpK TaxID=908842 RepID=A0A7C9QW98_9PROT|nr:peptidoglycan-binding domain-containing protein [Magnetospirillum aberrantis]NFV82125.1 peptidoglycan-binding protein [Magnetospirillum aberrantis SpK]